MRGERGRIVHVSEALLLGCGPVRRLEDGLPRGGLPAQSGSVRVGQVPQERPHGQSVDRHVMEDEREPRSAPGPWQDNHAQGQPLVNDQRCGEERMQLLIFSRHGDRGRHEAPRALRREDPLPGRAVALHNGRPESLVARNHVADGSGENPFVERIDIEQDREVVRRGVGDEVLLEPEAPLRGGRRQHPVRGPGKNGYGSGGLRRFHANSPRPDDRIREDVGDGEAQALLAQPADQSRREQGVPSQVEEVVVGVDHRHPDDLGHGVADHGLLRGRGGGASVPGEDRCGQPPPIDLAVGRQRHVLHHHDGARDGLTREPPGQGGADGPGIDITDDVADENGIGTQVRTRARRRRHDPVDVPQRGFDLAELDPETADFDLVIAASHEAQRAVGPAHDEVSGAVEAPASPCRIGHEAR